VIEERPSEFPTLVVIDDDDRAGADPTQVDPATVILTCANCGAQMDERKCKLIW
jgi:hypothetical protein